MEILLNANCDALKTDRVVAAVFFSGYFLLLENDLEDHPRTWKTYSS